MDAAPELNQLTETIIGAAFHVSNTLGAGFLERVYENALAHELRKRQLLVEQQYRLQVVYDGVVVGDFFADLLIEDVVLVELKAARAFDDAHVAQCINYLKATERRICLLLNFGTPRLAIKRIAN